MPYGIKIVASSRQSSARPHTRLDAHEYHHYQRHLVHLGPIIQKFFIEIYIIMDCNSAKVSYCLIMNRNSMLNFVRRSHQRSTPCLKRHCSNQLCSLSHNVYHSNEILPCCTAMACTIHIVKLQIKENWYAQLCQTLTTSISAMSLLKSIMYFFTRRISFNREFA